MWGFKYMNSYLCVRYREMSKFQIFILKEEAENFYYTVIFVRFLYRFQTKVASFFSNGEMSTFYVILTKDYIFFFLKHLNFAVNETAMISFLTHSLRKSQSVRQLRWEQNIFLRKNEIEKCWIKLRTICVLKRGIFYICWQSLNWKYIFPC